MNVAVIGTGKTGGKVVEVLPDEQVAGTFNSTRKPTPELLESADVAIIFVPGSAVEETMQTLLKSGVPAVWGSTGYEWPADLDSRLKQKGVKWLKASNFSLGMNIIRRCLRIISSGSEHLPDPRFHIHEIHHTGKKDAPSGTALSWREWLDKDAEITSERKGDVKGIHRLTMTTESETITIEHEAHRRELFAEGAIWAAEQLLDDSLGPGWYDFSTIFDQLMKSTD